MNIQQLFNYSVFNTFFTFEGVESYKDEKFFYLTCNDYFEAKQVQYLCKDLFSIKQDEHLNKYSFIFSLSFNGITVRTENYFKMLNYKYTENITNSINYLQFIGIQLKREYKKCKFNFDYIFFIELIKKAFLFSKNNKMNNINFGLAYETNIKKVHWFLVKFQDFKFESFKIKKTPYKFYYTNSDSSFIFGIAKSRRLLRKKGSRIITLNLAQEIINSINKKNIQKLLKISKMCDAEVAIK